MKNIIVEILKTMINYNKNITKNLTKFENYINYENKKLKILVFNYSKNQRYIMYNLLNINNLKNKEAFNALYNTIINEQTFLNFGSKKIILVTGETLSGIEISCHPNVYIDNNTTFEEY